MSKKGLSAGLLALAVILVISAAATLLPSDATTVSDMGYKSLCTFAPYSTATLLVLAGLAWVVRKYVDAQQVS
jgi:hypothetical protein